MKIIDRNTYIENETKKEEKIFCIKKEKIQTNEETRKPQNKQQIIDKNKNKNK